jgi:hypothetical protein
MIQYERKLPGELRACRCGRQPKHIETRGRPGALDFATPAVRHQLECAPCGARTAEHASLQEAVGEWEAAEPGEPAARARRAA